jgi:FixJ family two-component response regulator
LKWRATGSGPSPCIGLKTNISEQQHSIDLQIVPRVRPLIAVVDDEAPIRKALTRLLNSAGFAVEAFPSGVEFMKFIKTHRPDCLVLDLHMPVMDGFQVQELLGQAGHTIPVIVVTGHDSPDSRERAMAGRPVAYLRKPVDDQTLLDAIELAMSNNPPANDTNRNDPPTG